MMVPNRVLALPLVLVATMLALLAACGGEDEEAGGSASPDASAQTGVIQTFADQGRDHLRAGATYDRYNSNPPTSGPHAPSAAPWGVSANPIPKEQAVHNLEHGGVVVWYNCEAPPALDKTSCDKLKEDLGAVVRQMQSANKLVLMSAYSEMDQRIALTAWRTLLTLDSFDQGKVTEFIETYERKFNPEGF